jgi:Tn3 transposase DDE domain
VARAVFFDRLGERRDRTSKINATALASVAAIVLWNTVYLKRPVKTLREDGRSRDALVEKYPHFGLRCRSLPNHKLTRPNWERANVPARLIIDCAAT